MSNQNILNSEENTDLNSYRNKMNKVQDIELSYECKESEDSGLLVEYEKHGINNYCSRTKFFDELQEILNIAKNKNIIDSELYNVCKNGDIDLITDLINKHISGRTVCNAGYVGINGYTPLMWLCYNLNETSDYTNYIKIFELFIKVFSKECNHGAINNEGNTALILLCDGCWPSIKCYFKITKLLIDTFDIGLQPGHINNTGSTALLKACYVENIDIIRLIIISFGKDCNPGHADKEGETTLMQLYYLMYWGEEYIEFIELCKLFIEICGEDCNPGQADKDGNTVLLKLCYNASELDIDITENTKNIERFIEVFGKKCNPNHYNKEGNNAIMLLFFTNCCNIDLIKLLIRKIGNDFNPGYIDDENNYTILMNLCNEMPYNVNIVEIFIEEFGIDIKPNYISSCGDSALEILYYDLYNDRCIESNYKHYIKIIKLLRQLQ